MAKFDICEECKHLRFEKETNALFCELDLNPYQEPTELEWTCDKRKPFEVEEND